MNIKKIIILLLFTIAIAGIIAPVNAEILYDFTTPKIKTINGKTKLKFRVLSNIGWVKKNWKALKYKTARKKELNNINKVVVKFEGNKAITFKKPVKGWKIDKDGMGFYKPFTINGSPINKTYTISYYNKKGTIIKKIKHQYIAEKPWI